jgi:hypothetical protein
MQGIRVRTDTLDLYRHFCSFREQRARNGELEVGERTSEMVGYRGVRDILHQRSRSSFSPYIPTGAQQLPQKEAKERGKAGTDLNSRHKQVREQVSFLQIPNTQPSASSSMRAPSGVSNKKGREQTFSQSNLPVRSSSTSTLG